MQLNKNTSSKTLAYCLMLFSIALPVLFILMTMLFGMIAVKISGDFSAGDGVAFIMIFIGAPVAFLLFVAGMILSFFIGILTKSKDLLIISLIPIVALGYAFWRAHLLTENSKGLIFNAFGTFVTEYPRWLYIGYACLVLIVAGYYFYKKKFSASPPYDI